MLKDYKLEDTVEPLLAWFSKHARVLPWRENPTPYYVWISEIMLQQTRVEAVKPYFDRFVSELPNAKALAECEEDRLLKLWEGLGYYNRVRNLQIAARQIMEQFGGCIPSEYENLLQLKGIGHYTAGAIASIAYGKPQAAVDGNVLRVISRVSGDDSDIMSTRVRGEMEARINDLLQQYIFPENTMAATPGSHIPASKFNQALMELGAMVCVPNGTPHCEDCPWYAICVARREDQIARLPVKQKAKARRIEDRTVLVIRDGDRVAIQKRPDKGLLAGLYQLPNLSGHLTEAQVLEFTEKAGYRPLRVQRLDDAKHIFSHVEWHMIGYVIWVEDLTLAVEGCGHSYIALEERNQAEQANMVMTTETSGEMKGLENMLFVEAADARERYAIPTAFSKYAAYMNIALGI